MIIDAIIATITGFIIMLLNLLLIKIYFTVWKTLPVKQYLYLD